jgi:hypothetical protein
MAITAGITNSFRQEVLQGLHLAGNTYKIALYTDAATIGPTSTVYTTDGEVVGDGYTAAGQDLVGFTAGVSGAVAWIDFTTDPSWPASTITARGAMIYNSSVGNRAVLVIDFGGDITSTAGMFTVTFPVPASTTALIRLSGG